MKPNAFHPSLALLLLATTGSAYAGSSGKVNICHRTNGSQPYQEISVSSSALSAHTAHGDVTAGTYYLDADGDGYGAASSTSTCPSAGYTATAGDCDDADADSNPGADEVCDDGVDNDCDGSVDEDCDDGDTCGGGGDASFSDNFDRADGALGSDYLSFDWLESAEIVAGEACGLDHEMALTGIDATAGSLTVSFDFNTEGAGLEVWSVAADLCTGGVVLAGVQSGGFLTIMDLATGATPLHVCLGVEDGYGNCIGDFLLDHDYHLEATFEADGDVSLTVTDGVTVVGAGSGNVGGALSWDVAGSIIGRNADVGFVCIDDLAIDAL